jgi:very-short-patch-repair endonuclease
LTFPIQPYTITHMRSTITCTCENCQKQFQAELRHIKYLTKQGYRSGRFCSKECSRSFQAIERKTSIDLACVTCGKIFTRAPAQITGSGRNKSDRSFCSRSCATTYNNTHKTTGTRRSKLESYLEERLRTEFHDLLLICNGKDAIGSELDFYFPQLRLAIELNGIFHYEPIYGTDKLEQIQANDQQKSCLLYTSPSPRDH